MSKQGEPREPAWTESEYAYLRENYGTAPLREIAATLGRGYKAVGARANRLGLRTRQRPEAWTEADEAYLIANYETVPTLKIAKALGRTHATIKVHADQLGLLSQKRRATAAIRHDYFDVINSPIKAYVLGILASDGWVSYNRNEIGLGLQSKDHALVELVRDEIAPLHRVIADRKHVDFRLSSGQIKAALIDHGVTPRKSLTLQWPSGLPDGYEASFILGCFDGDGCLSYDKTREYYQWSLVSASRSFLEEVRSRIRAATEVKIQGPYGRRNGNRALSIHYRGPSIYALDEWLHAAVAGLDRKRPKGHDVAARAARVPRPQRTAAHCINGHEITEANSYIDGRGVWFCRPCKRQSNREAAQRARDGTAPWDTMCIYCSRKGTRGFSAVHTRTDDYVDQWSCENRGACERRQERLMKEVMPSAPVARS